MSEVEINYRINVNLEHNPMVSVIVATYQRDVTLYKALSSLLEQTYSNVEIIVVNDNAISSWNAKVDKIIGKINKESEHPIIYIKNGENKGSAETRNIGINAASGEYVTFLDDDDMYLPKKVQHQVSHMIEEKSDYSITDLELYDENGKFIEKRRRNYISKTGKEDLLVYHMMHHMTGTDTMMFKKDYLLHIGGFPPIDLGDEFYLMQNAIEAGGEFSYFSGCDVKAYVHTETDGLSSGLKKIQGENKLYEYKQKYFNKLSLDEQRYISMRHYAVLAFAFFRMKKQHLFIAYAVKSFLASPIDCLNLVINRK